MRLTGLSSDREPEAVKAVRRLVSKFQMDAWGGDSDAMNKGIMAVIQDPDNAIV